MFHAECKRGPEEGVSNPSFYVNIYDEEVVETVIPYIEANPKYKKAKVLERIVEPERVIQFRVPWISDSGEPQVNRGFRVEFNSAIGPYKSGLRFLVVFQGVLIRNKWL